MRLIVLFTAVLLGMLVLQAPVAMAHTKLSSSNPAEGAVVSEPLQEIVLTFNTEIEPLSTFTLKDEGGNEVAGIGVSVQGTEMTGLLEQAAGNGRYTVEWKIVGRDGHPIQGELGFEVAVAAEGDSRQSLPPQQETEASSQPDGQAVESAAPARGVEPTGEAAQIGNASATNAAAGAANSGSDEGSSLASPAAGETQNGSGSRVMIWVIAGLAVGAVIVLAAGRRRKKP